MHCSIIISHYSSLLSLWYKCAWKSAICWLSNISKRLIEILNSRKNLCEVLPYVTEITSRLCLQLIVRYVRVFVVEYFTKLSLVLDISPEPIIINISIFWVSLEIHVTKETKTRENKKEVIISHISDKYQSQNHNYFQYWIDFVTIIFIKKLHECEFSKISIEIV